jgi:hypothetical protein
MKPNLPFVSLFKLIFSSPKWIASIALVTILVKLLSNFLEFGLYTFLFGMLLVPVAVIAYSELRKRKSDNDSTDSEQ